MGSTLVVDSTALTAALESYEVAAFEYRDAALKQAELEARRPVEKLEAIARIMEQPNTLTGKAHSYSSAEAAVETDKDYQHVLKMAREAAYVTHLKFSQMERARLYAKAVVAMAGGAQ